MGLLSPLGRDLDRAWQRLASHDTHPVTHTHRLDDETWGAFPVFRVEDFVARDLALSDGARAYAEAHDAWRDCDLMFFVAVLLDALGDAGLDPQHLPDDLGLVLTHENPGVDRHVEDLWRGVHAARTALGTATRQQVAEQLYDMAADRVYDLQTFMPLHRVARLLGIHGHSIFVNNACASGLYALDAAAMLLQSGRCRTVLVAGADHPLSYPKYRWFASQGLAAGDGRMQPFDRDRHGFVLGDGAAALVVESEAAARGRGVRPYAAYRGGGFRQEAWKVTLPDPASRHYETAIRSALAAADVRPEDIDWLVAHGASTSVADAYEARTLTAIFGPEFEAPRLTAFKPDIGHNLGGSGVSETVLLLLAMRHGELPALRGCDHPDPSLRVRPLRAPAREMPRLAMKCAAGFGGFDAACIFERLE
jgi:3-oxoacyl-(acyl-carrier-protein) synthase